MSSSFAAIKSIINTNHTITMYPKVFMIFRSLICFISQDGV